MVRAAVSDRGAAEDAQTAFEASVRDYAERLWRMMETEADAPRLNRIAVATQDLPHLAAVWQRIFRPLPF